VSSKIKGKGGLLRKIPFLAQVSAELQGVTQVEKNPRSDTLQDRGSHLMESKARFNILYMLVAEKTLQYLPKLKLNSIESYCTIHVVIITHSLLRRRPNLYLRFLKANSAYSLLTQMMNPISDTGNQG
jgi:hypothetical protein